MQAPWELMKKLRENIYIIRFQERQVPGVVRQDIQTMVNTDRESARVLQIEEYILIVVRSRNLPLLHNPTPCTSLYALLICYGFISPVIHQPSKN